jgi:hypothetical protein
MCPGKVRKDGWLHPCRWVQLGQSKGCVTSYPRMLVQGSTGILSGTLPTSSSKTLTKYRMRTISLDVLSGCVHENPGVVCGSVACMEQYCAPRDNYQISRLDGMRFRYKVRHRGVTSWTFPSLHHPYPLSCLSLATESLEDSQYSFWNDCLWSYAFSG